MRDRIYSSLGEHYLGKLRYDDAAKTYKGFVALYPFHRAAPRFSMRVVDTFTQGGFPSWYWSRSVSSPPSMASRRILATFQTKSRRKYWPTSRRTERPRDALSRPVSERKRSGREAHELSRASQW